MKINAVKLIYFSPTKSTKKTVTAIAEGLAAEKVEHIDVTLSETRTQPFREVREELVIIGTPVYGGRIPLVAVQRLQGLKVRSAPAVVVVVYGNRAYEDALLELKNLALDAGFTVVAAAAFVGEHSLATESVPIANGRPDAQDYRKAQEFGRSIREKMEHIQTLGEALPLNVPGNTPYKERAEPHKVSPVTKETLCNACGKCVPLCPVGTITLDTFAVSDPSACIRCCACVRGCPEGARAVVDPALLERAKQLSLNCRDRKEPETYL